MPKEYGKITTARLEPELKQKVTEAAELESRSVSRLINQALAEYIENHYDDTDDASESAA